MLDSQDVETKKEKLEWLKKLKEMKEQGVDITPYIKGGCNPTASSFVPGRSFAPQRPAQHETTYGYADEDEDDEFEEDDDPYQFWGGGENFEDEFDDELEAFERELMLAQGGGSATAPATPHSTTTSAAAPAMANVHLSMRARGEAGEFEAFRLAKLGDTESFLNYVPEEDINVKSFTDNRGRNCLHFAADSGNVDLVRKLLEMGCPFVADENGMNPMDIAVLRGISEAAAVMKDLVKEPFEDRSAADVARKFAPQPPRMALSRPPPVVPADAKRLRTFWGPQATAPAALQKSEAQVFAPGAFPLGVDALMTIYREASITGLDALAWALPVSDEELTSMLATSAIAGSATDGEVNGSAIIVPLYKVSHGISSISSAAVGAWVLKDSARRTAGPAEGVASHVLHAIAAFLRNETDVKCVWFHTSCTLLHPPVAVVKWYRRIIDVPQLINSGDAAAAVIYNDYLKSDTLLAADTILRSTPRPAAVEALQQWFSVSDLDDAAKDEQFALIANALRERKRATSGAFWITDNAVELRGLFDRAGLSVFCKAREDSGISDVLVLRRKVSTTGSLTAGVIAFAFVTGDTTTYLNEAAAVAQQLNMVAIYATNTFGMLEKDFRMGFFEEVPRAHEFIYAVADPKSTSSPVTAVTPDKISLPICLL